MVQEPTITLADIDSLLQDNELQRKELDADAIALARVKKMILRRAMRNGLPQESLAATPKPVAEDRSVELHGVGFNEAVRRVARGLVENFTAPIIESVLFSNGVKMPENPRQRIAMELKKLCDAGKIVKTAAGTGNTPHVYKVA